MRYVFHIERMKTSIVPGDGIDSFVSFQEIQQGSQPSRGSAGPNGNKNASVDGPSAQVEAISRSLFTLDAAVSRLRSQTKAATASTRPMSYSAADELKRDAREVEQLSDSVRASLLSFKSTINDMTPMDKLRMQKLVKDWARICKDLETLRVIVDTVSSQNDILPTDTNDDDATHATMKLEPLAAPNYDFDIDDESHVEMQRVRADKIQKLHEEIAQLNSLFKDVSALVNQQAVELDQADANVASTESHVEAGASCLCCRRSSSGVNDLALASKYKYAGMLPLMGAGIGACVGGPLGATLGAKGGLLLGAAGIGGVLGAIGAAGFVRAHSNAVDSVAPPSSPRWSSWLPWPRSSSAPVKRTVEFDDSILEDESSLLDR